MSFNRLELWLIFLAIIFYLLSGSQVSYNPIGFTPKISENCAGNLSKVALLLEPNSCGPNISQILLSPSTFTACTSDPYGGSCFNIQNIMYRSEKSKFLVPVFRLNNQSSCPICTKSSGIAPFCPPLISSLVDLSFGIALNYSQFKISNQTLIEMLNSISTQSYRSCGNSFDQTSLQIFQQQSYLLCSTSNTFNLNVSYSGNIEGILDMRSLSQCGLCAVVPCLPGQLCDGNGKAKMCPAGHYCPTPASKLECPSGYYCPIGSTSPKKCRSIASGSCPARSEREVVWVPLFIEIIFLVAVFSLSYYLVLQERNYSNTFQKSDKIVRVANVQSVQLSDQVAPVSIQFEDLWLISGKNARISGISGTIKPKKFTAILGGSGAGKTSLLNVILGRENRTSGEVRYTCPNYSKNRIPSQLIDRIVAFVPQNDIYLHEMTVYQLIQHSARWRLPSHFSPDQIDQRVEQVLTQLHLQHLKNHLAGATSSTDRPLSPGDRKKINIALELVSSPNVLFLDEPTTGIDSSSALNVIKIVRNLAKGGMTCVAVIHQPRAEIFSLIDEIIILVRGGKVAYHGPVEFVLSYFEQFGYHISEAKANKTDFLIDITSKDPTFDQSDSSLGWSELWNQHGKEFLDAMESQQTTKKSVLQGPEEIPQLDGSTEYLPIDIPRFGFSRQLQLFFIRGIQQHFKNNAFLSDLMTYFIAGIIMGIVSCGGPLFINAIPVTYAGSCPPGAEVRCNSWIRFEIGPATFLMTMILGAVTIPFAVKTFGREKEVFSRESAVGANKYSYFLGKVFSDLPFIVLHSFIYMAPIVAIAPWQSPLDKLYGSICAITFVVTSLGYLVSFLITDPDVAVLAGVILAILLNLFSGFVPKIGDGPIGLIMYTHWAARALTTTELKYGQGISSTSSYNSVVPANWKFPDLARDLEYIILIGVLIQLSTFFLLLYKNRRISTF